ncbi:MAG TPA: hypothetical protein DEQ77_00475, partial [Candidatus Omnitrophica bacterium]|nr:hypothetical protein [Candidatus Omnitrophota bacterium]
MARSDNNLESKTGQEALEALSGDRNKDRSRLKKAEKIINDYYKGITEEKATEMSKSRDSGQQQAGKEALEKLSEGKISDAAKLMNNYSESETTVSQQENSLRKKAQDMFSSKDNSKSEAGLDALEALSGGKDVDDKSRLEKAEKAIDDYYKKSESRVAQRDKEKQQLSPWATERAESIKKEISDLNDYADHQLREYAKGVSPITENNKEIKDADVRGMPPAKAWHIVDEGFRKDTGPRSGRPEGTLKQKIQGMDELIKSRDRAGKILQFTNFVPFDGVLFQIGLLSSIAIKEKGSSDIPDFIKGGIATYRVDRHTVGRINDKVSELKENRESLEKERNELKEYKEDLDAEIKNRGDAQEDLSRFRKEIPATEHLQEDSQRLSEEINDLSEKISQIDKSIDDIRKNPELKEHSDVQKTVDTLNKTSSPKDNPDKDSNKRTIEQWQTEGVESVYYPSVSGISQPIEVYGNNPEFSFRESNLSKSLPEIRIQRNEKTIKDAIKRNAERGKRTEKEEVDDALEALRNAIGPKKYQALEHEAGDNDYKLLSLGDRHFILNSRNEGIKNAGGDPDGKILDGLRRISWIDGEGENKEAEVRENISQISSLTLYSPEYDLQKSTSVDRFGRQQETSYYGHEYNPETKEYDNVKLDKATQHYYGSFGYEGSITTDYTEIEMPKEWPSANYKEKVKAEEARPVPAEEKPIAKKEQSQQSQPQEPAQTPMSKTRYGLPGKSATDHHSEPLGPAYSETAQEVFNKGPQSRTRGYGLGEEQYQKEEPSSALAEEKPIAKTEQPQQPTPQGNNAANAPQVPDSSDWQNNWRNQPENKGGDKSQDNIAGNNQEQTHWAWDALKALPGRNYRDNPKLDEAQVEHNNLESPVIHTSRQKQQQTNSDTPTWDWQKNDWKDKGSQEGNDNNQDAASVSAADPTHWAWKALKALPGRNYRDNPKLDETQVEKDLASPSPVIHVGQQKQPLKPEAVSDIPSAGDNYSPSQAAAQPETAPAQKQPTVTVKETVVPHRLSFGPNVSYDWSIYDTGNGARPYDGPKHHIRAEEINSGNRLKPENNFDIPKNPITSEAWERQKKHNEENRPGVALGIVKEKVKQEIEKNEQAEQNIEKARKQAQEASKELNEYDDESKVDRILSFLPGSNPEVNKKTEGELYQRIKAEKDADINLGKTIKIKENLVLSLGDSFVLTPDGNLIPSEQLLKEIKPEVDQALKDRFYQRVENGYYGKVLQEGAERTEDGKTIHFEAADEREHTKLTRPLTNLTTVSFYRYASMPVSGGGTKEILIPILGLESGSRMGAQEFYKINKANYNRKEITKMIEAKEVEAEAEGLQEYSEFLGKVKDNVVDIKDAQGNQLTVLLVDSDVLEAFTEYYENMSSSSE